MTANRAKTNRYDPPMEHRPLFAGMKQADYNALKFKAFERALVKLSDVIRANDDLRTSIVLDDFINRLSTERRKLVQHNASWFEPSFALFSYAWRTHNRWLDDGYKDAATALWLALQAFMPDDLTLAEIGLADDQQPSAPQPAITRIPVTADEEPKTTPRRSRRPSSQTTQSTQKARNTTTPTKGRSS